MQVPCDVLRQMYATHTAVDASGAVIQVSSEISTPLAEALYRFVRQRKPSTVIEIGMANGASALSILTALYENGAGHLISIDPGQLSQWKGCGIENVRRAGFSDRHQLIEDYDYRALPRLLEQGMRVDFGYIDGWHTFDYTALDWFYIDKMTPVGGVIAFNDAGWLAVHKAIRAFQTHRKYRELDVGLRRSTAGGNIVKSVVKTVMGIRNEDRYFEKTEDWTPPFDYYARF